jgi:hypothetical protein
MNQSAVEAAVSNVQRVVLGVLVAALGMTAYGVSVRALPDGRYVVGVGAGALSVLAVLLVAALFVEAWRDGWRADLSATADSAAFETLRRVVLGVLVAVFGLASAGIALEAAPAGQYPTAVVGAAGALAALAVLAGLFVEGMRSR